MQRIHLSGLLPQVFVQGLPVAPDHQPQSSFRDSEVWLGELILERGKIYLLEASSGAGKTSLCSFLYGYRSDYIGSILFDQKDIRSLRIPDWVEIRRRHLALLYQEMRLFPELTVLENIQLKNQLTQHRSRADIIHLLDELGIVDKADQLVGKLSIGQQQRVALIRTLCQPYDFLLLDEPISHLDDMNAEIVANLVRRESEAQGAGIIATSVGKHLPLDYDRVWHL